eukprot:m.119145 g.119145  ORF g.119145 m.119145 type:complete len:111 (+) comp14305_c2_seq2:1156-1488(+)
MMTKKEVVESGILAGVGIEIKTETVGHHDDHHDDLEMIREKGEIPDEEMTREIEDAEGTGETMTEKEGTLHHLLVGDLEVAVWTGNEHDRVSSSSQGIKYYFLDVRKFAS